ncbi:hypothetical protein NQ315_009673 [Exocentrus adspersus]|uniref:RNA 3'-terminal phosphate cyclase n=1 Tax=Exocentrus adspersus TaxID=1586481 RepID=A0AAV8WHV9_9CUCU|nr:hypothetical protein NQ315_009673 [Exocentrus adspersus]
MTLMTAVSCHYSAVLPTKIQLNCQDAVIVRTQRSSAMSQIVEIDGSLLEGGGQILRVAVTLCALKKIAVRIRKIRGGRSKPGLMEQHLKGVELARDICNARVKGLALGSTEIEFHPGELRGGTQVKTAGSISLLLQVALPCVIFAPTPSTLALCGGTNAEMAPQIDYTVEVFRPILEKFGATFDFSLTKRGYFPRGGGEVEVRVEPVKSLNAINMEEQGNITTIYGWSFVAGVLPISLAHQVADSATNALRNVFNDVNIETYKEDRNVAPDNCSGIILVAETDTKCILGSSALGKRTEKAEITGKKAADDLLDTIRFGACVDQHSQDQIIIFMALAKGVSKVKVGPVTMHTKTAIFVVETLTKVKFIIHPVNEHANIIECSGS